MISPFKTYHVLAFYCLTPLETPQQEVERQQEFLKGRDVTCRVYISEQGINGQMCLSEEDARAYIQWMQQDPRFIDTDFKTHLSSEHVFPRLSIKRRKQLVALDTPVDLSQRGEYVSPKVWREMLEEKDPDTVILDVRNSYEWKIGHFEGAHKPECEKFREFPKLLRELRHQYSTQTTMMMYCTGGIRCELYSALLKKEGFQSVYQLKGGVIAYGLQEGHAHWKGKLFVFDDRLAVPISTELVNEANSVISQCHYCKEPSSTYYNCALMTCNHLFL